MNQLTKTFKLFSDAPGIGRAGDVVTMAVTPSETGDQLRVIDTYLGGYKNRSYLADQISPPVLVDTEKGKRIDFSKENAFQHVDPRAGRQGGIKEVEHLNERTDYQTEEFALASFIPWAAENDAVRQYNVRQETSKLLMNKLLLDREIRVATALFTLNNWNANNRTTLLDAGKWNGGASADPLKDIQTRLEKSAQPVSFMIANPVVAFHLLRDAKIVTFMRQVYGDEKVDSVVQGASFAQESTVVKLAALPDLIICPAKKLNESTGNLDYIWGNDLAMVTTASGMSPDEMASFMTFRTRGRSGSGVVTNEYMPYGRGINGGTMLEVGFGEDIFFPSNISGGLIKACVQ
jgi:hypothetical protein